jgi:hypothetical protein
MSTAQSAQSTEPEEDEYTKEVRKLIPALGTHTSNREIVAVANRFQRPVRDVFQYAMKLKAQAEEK